MNWEKWRSELRAATLSAFDEMSAGLKGEQLYAVSLQTDDGAMTVGLCANVEEGYAERMAAEADEFGAQEAAYNRWAPAEWRYEMFGDEVFDTLNADLREAIFDPDCDFDAHFSHLLDAMADALAHLRAERGPALENVTLFVTISDSDDTEAVEDRYATQLNPPHLAQAFLQRYA
ncbi:DUF4303 domain-containing protein [Sphingomonas sp. ASY06-1R]|jgi:hypothetical protein|uniref:DUF4303 domain-containing protein n=1 Tax=Sphingomonas sp. ASY06-1R TaxID=3445771 RepID=UPI003FA2460B